MEKTTVLYVFLAVAAGTLGGMHIPINGALGARINSTLVATFTFYGIAFLLISGLVLATRQRSSFAALTEVPPWYFVAGLISVLVVGASTFLIPRLGAANLFAIFVASQLVVRMVISHFGWLASPVQPISTLRVVGAALLLVGAILVVRPQ